MPTELKAIGVGEGDAFFLRRGKVSTLVDGGKSTRGFPDQFRSVTGQSGVDFLICTHNDADHANGVIGFLDSGLDCREVWLPGNWTKRLEDLLADPTEFVIELAKDCSRAELQEQIGLQDFSVADDDSEGQPDQQLDITPLDENLTIAAEAAPAGNSLMVGWPFVWWFHGRLHQYEYLHALSVMNPHQHSLFIDAIDAAKRIREIALLALNRNLTIRWFAFEPDRDVAPQTHHLLWPINASQLVHLSPSGLSALCYLALTVSNQQSLVLHSPGDGTAPSVLFTADSDLAFRSRLPADTQIAVTAPHHGAESNSTAYQRVSDALSIADAVTWVRSDKKSQTRPGPSYLSAPGHKYCTLCRGATHLKQHVHLVGDGGRWKALPSTRGCTCV